MNDLLKMPKKEKTFLETLKVHDKEVPLANLLGFFLKPQEQHGLGDLFIKSLLETECYDLRKRPCNRLCDNGYFYDEVEDKFSEAGVFDFPQELVKAHVSVEEPTEDGKRIDILINSDRFVIAIEFKINHSLNNPLTSYREYMKKNGKGKVLFFVVLSPIQKQHEKDEEVLNEYRQVVLRHFVERVNQQSGSEKRIHPYCFWLDDFIKTIENRFFEATIRNEIIEKGYATIQSILEKDTSNGNVVKEWRKQFEHFENQIQQKLRDLKRILKSGDIRKGKDRFNYFLEIKETDNQVLKIRLELRGWSIERWEMKDKMTRIGVCNSKPISYETSSSSIVSKLN